MTNNQSDNINRRLGWHDGRLKTGRSKADAANRMKQMDGATWKSWKQKDLGTDSEGIPQKEGNSSALREKARPEREKRRNSETQCVTSEEVPAKGGLLGGVEYTMRFEKMRLKGAISIKYWFHLAAKSTHAITVLSNLDSLVDPLCLHSKQWRLLQLLLGLRGLKSDT